MSRNPAATAWVVILSSFFTCCLLVFAVPTATNWYFAQALDVRTAKLEVIAGTAIIQLRGSPQEVATITKAELREGDAVRTAGNTQAIIWLPDGSNIRLWPEASLTAVRLRSSRYNSNNSVIQLRQDSGHSRVEVALLTALARTFQITTPEALITVREGSYSIDLHQGRTEVSAQHGSATVEGGGRSVELLRAERSTVVEGNPPEDPVPSARNLIANGDMTMGLAEWQWGNRDEEEPVVGKVTAEVVDGLPAMRMLRTGATKHAETYLVQSLNRDVTDFQSLKLGLDLKLIQQSLSGGGWLGSEYPLMVKVKYRDVWGSENVFRRGFYFQNADGHPTTNGEQVEHDVWVTRTYYDLFDRTIADPRPAYILSVELAGSGWNYESLATNIRLIAQ